MFKLPLKYKNVYLVGIKGVGMTMLAQFLKAAGAQVSGSDIPEVFLTDKILKRSGIKVFLGFREENIPMDIKTVIYSSAYSPSNNVELAALVEHPKIKLVSYAAALGEIFSQHQGVAVCGSHGKTTTSAWLGYVLDRAGANPSVLVGSGVPQLGGSAKLGKSRLFVAEVDEYQNKLQYFQPYGVLLNNIDYDHPDFFPTKKSYTQVFTDFVTKIPRSGFLVANHSDAQVRKLYPQLKGRLWTYDLFTDEVAALKAHKQVNLSAYDYEIKKGRQYFSVLGYGRFKIQLLGRHNIYNALAVLGAALDLKIPLPLIKKYLALFKGTVRRAQPLGVYQGVPVFDDYAHHPTEVKATLSAFSEAYPHKRLVAVFHPHTFTRTKALFKDFITSFVAADEVVIIDIYGSARERQGGISSRDLVKAIQEFNKKQKHHQRVVHRTDLEDVEAYLRRTLKQGDLLLLLGAGDIFRVGEKLIANK